MKRHLSHSLTQIKKYYLYKDLGDFDFPITDFLNLQKSMAFKNEMLSFSNYRYYKKLIKKNAIKCKYWSYEDLFKNKKNYINFLSAIKISNFDKKFDYSKYSQKNYPVKFYDRTFFGKLKSVLLKKYFKRKIDKVINDFKRLSKKMMKKIFQLIKKI